MSAPPDLDPQELTLFLQLGVPLVLLVLGWMLGRIAERRHYRSIHQREDYLLEIPVTNERRLWDATRPVAEARLVKGSVVVSVDYFKRFLAWLRGIFGGEIEAYSPLLDRARREAALRLRESFPEADIFLNFRFETSTLSGSGRLGTVEVLAYATGVRYAH